MLLLCHNSRTRVKSRAKAIDCRYCWSSYSTLYISYLVLCSQRRFCLSNGSNRADDIWLVLLFFFSFFFFFSFMLGGFIVSFLSLALFGACLFFFSFVSPLFLFLLTWRRWLDCWSALHTCAICRSSDERLADDVERSSRLPGAGVGFILPGRFLHGHERPSQRFFGQYSLRRPLFTQSRGTRLAQSTARTQMAGLPLQRYNHIRPRIQSNHHTRASSSSTVLQRQLPTVRAFCWFYFALDFSFGFFFSR